VVPNLQEREARLTANDWKLLNDPPFKPRGIKTIEGYRKKKPKGAEWWWDLTPEQRVKAERKLYYFKKTYAAALADPKIYYWKWPLLIANAKANVLHPVKAPNIYAYRRRLYAKKGHLAKKRKHYHNLRAYLEGVIDEYPAYAKRKPKQKVRTFQVPLG
jgi:hypothetical protein